MNEHKGYLLDFDEELEVESVKFLDTVSRNVMLIREEKGLTKLEVSRLMGFMTPDHYSRMELRSNGKHFNLKHLYKLSRIFDVDFSKLTDINSKH